MPWPARTLEQRFWMKVEKCEADECWPWTAALGDTGYGRLQLADGRQGYAHRVSYELNVGPIPDGLVIDHLCRNRWCVNPTHLEPVTSRENTMRGENFSAINAAKSECDKGHDFDATNTYEAFGRRYCRTCRRDYMAEYRARKAA